MDTICTEGAPAVGKEKEAWYVLLIWMVRGGTGKIEKRRSVVEMLAGLAELS
jgi:hypothetical protein